MPKILDKDNLVFTGHAIRWYRREKKITQQQMAKELGMHRDTYRHREYYSSFTPDELDTIARVLNLVINISIEEKVEGEGDGIN